MTKSKNDLSSIAEDLGAEQVSQHERLDILSARQILKEMVESNNETRSKNAMSKPLTAEVFCSHHDQYVDTENFHFIGSLGRHERDENGRCLGAEANELIIRVPRAINWGPAKTGTRYRITFEEIEEDSTE